jgi:hypothetical protein
MALMAYDFSQKNARSFVKISNWIWDCEREVHALSRSLALALAFSLCLSLSLSLSLSLFHEAPSLLSLFLSLSLCLSQNFKLDPGVRVFRVYQVSN